MNSKNSTTEKIKFTAYTLFLRHGIKKTSLEEVANAAGITRVTVYHYFTDKQHLVHETFSIIPGVLNNILAGMDQGELTDIDACVEEIASQLSSLAQGDLPTLLNELKTLYPDLFYQFDEARRKAINEIFNSLITQSKEQGKLRAQLNQKIIRAYFYTIVVNILFDPGLQDQGLSASEVFHNVSKIFLHGILED
ncbi:MAG: hypothetical protein C0410_11780 [Anaerolinea sp.]|nr:hypothetical protein [Anaerolinea sp.]